MSVYTTITATLAGVCAAFGFIFLFIGLRRQPERRLNLLFALFAICYAITIFGGLRFHYIPSAAAFEATTIARWDVLFASLAFVALIWFIAEYTFTHAPLFLWALTAVLLVTGLVAFGWPEAFNGTQATVVPITLLWGESILQIQPSSFWYFLLLFSQLAVLWFLIVAANFQHRLGKRRKAVFLGISGVWFILAVGYDMLTRLGNVGYFPSAEVGFIGLAIVMVLQLSDSIISTEKGLEQSYAGLETRVVARTIDLQRANQRLEQEILAREQIELEQHQAAEALQQQVLAFEILHQIALTLSQLDDLNSALHQVCAKVTRLFDASFTYIMTPDPAVGNQVLMIGFERDTGPVEPIIVASPLTQIPLIPLVVQQGKPLQLSAIEDEDRDEKTQDLFAQAQAFLTDRQISKLLILPLLTHGQVIGIMSIATDKVGRDFQAAEIRLAETISSDVAAAVENARLIRQAQAAAVSEERNRLARDLHDAMTQTIFAATLIAEALPQVWKRNPEEGLRNLGKLRQLVRGALAEMRTLLFELRPSALEAAELQTLLHQLSDVFTGRTQIPVNLQLHGNYSLPLDVKIGFYRIVQESLNNIAKHARASRVSVSLNMETNCVTMVLKDNGRGFNRQAVASDRFGLQIMQERAAAIGAELKINSTIGRGTTIHVKWQTNGERL